MRQFALQEAINLLLRASGIQGRNLQMPGDPQYQPKELKPYLGYDQRVGWQIIVEWAWFCSLAKNKVMPSKTAELLASDLLEKLLYGITTTAVTELERKPEVGHDVIALRMLMEEILPKGLHPWLHLGLTSYDTISTAFAVQAKQTFDRVFFPKLLEIDDQWRGHMKATAEVLQIGRTHLQDALPITVGAWLAVLHRRFKNSARMLRRSSIEIPGKFSGAVGFHNAITVLAPGCRLEETALEFLGLPEPQPATQLPLPEGLEGFYHSMVVLSAALANLGEDIRHLQSSSIGEITSASSTSSTMSHKTANPIAAENMAGMHVSARAEFLKVLETMNSDLQRDLRYSNVMRGYPAVMVFVYQQLLTAVRVFKSFAVNEVQCRNNFDRSGNLVVAELLHLSLQRAGYPDAHKFINKHVVPLAKASGRNFLEVMNEMVKPPEDEALKAIWKEISCQIAEYLLHPEKYIGTAIKTAYAEAENRL